METQLASNLSFATVAYRHLYKQEQGEVQTLIYGPSERDIKRLHNGRKDRGIFSWGKAGCAKKSGWRLTEVHTASLSSRWVGFFFTFRL